MRPRFGSLRQARLKDLPMDKVEWRFGYEADRNIVITGFMGQVKRPWGGRSLKAGAAFCRYG